MKRLTSLTMGLVLAGLAAAGGAQERPADWERAASEHAVKAFAAALAKNQAKAEENLKALGVLRGAPLPEEVVAANRDRGFVLFQRSYRKFILRKQPPAAEETAVKAVGVEIARNEWEPVQLGIWSLRDLKDVSFAVGDLASANGVKLDAEVRRYFGFNLWTPVAKKGGADLPDGDIVVGEKVEFKSQFNETPCGLLDLASIDVPKDEARCLWLDIHVPAGAAAGEYAGAVTVSVGGAEAARLPLTVKVRPFVLDENPEWGRGPFTSKLLAKKDLLHLRENGMNMMSWWTGGYKVNLKGGKITADFSSYVNYLKLLDECGYVRKHAVFLGGSDPKIQNRLFELLKRPTIGKARDASAGKDFARSDMSPPFGDYLCQVMKAFHEQMTAAGHPQMVACLLDEPDHNPRPQRPTWYNKMFALVEKGAPEVPLYGTFYHAGDEDRLSNHHKVWTTNRPAKKIAEKCRAAGAELRTYGGSGKYNQAPDRTRFQFGIMPWIFGAGGSYFWAYHWHTGDVFDPWSITNVSTTSLPTPAGPLPSAMLKGGYREGIDDHRYLATLEKLIAAAEKAGPDAAKAEAAQHLAFLDSFRKPLFDGLTVVGGTPDFSRVGKVQVKGTDGSTAALGGQADGWAFCEFVRADAARRIESLAAKLK